MVALPQRQHNTINKIYEAYERRNQDEKPRPHLGGSLIGKPCERELWYSFRWCNARTFEGRMLRLFETGELAEDRFVANLQAAGVEVFNIDQNTGNQYRISGLHGHFAGSLDGVGVGFAEAPKAYHVIEMKTHNEKSFTKLKKEGVRVAEPEHYAQMQVYMGHTEIERAYYLAVNKNTDELYGERVKFDKEVFETLMKKAERIIASDKPPTRINNDPAHFQCKWCDQKDLCHGTAAPQVNCRTCAHSTPVMDGEGGKWRCEFHDADIPTEFQSSSECPDHTFIPDLLANWAEPIDSNGHSVKYKNLLTENEFWNGKDGYSGGYTSKEIRAAHDKKCIGNPEFDAIREKFDGEIVG